MNELIELIRNDECRGAVKCADGSVHKFMHRGVIDLYRLVVESGIDMSGGFAADRVIGRGAALLLVKARVKCVYAFMISVGAQELLLNNGVEVECEKVVDYIVNRTGDGMCPVEKLTLHTDDPDEAVKLIGSFLENVSLKNNLI